MSEGDWIIEITLNARVSAIRERIEPILRNLEERDVREVRVNYLLGKHDNQLFEALRSLGNRHTYCFRMPGTGQVHMSMEGSGGGVDSAGSALPQWMEEFLRDPQRADVLFKVGQSGAHERWVFVLVGFGGAPWSVDSYLTGELEYLPPTEPDLPSPVTGIWVASTFGTHGVRWDGAGWRSFRARE
jgi:hypothetical protein